MTDEPEQQRKILVVDDDKALCQMMATVLQQVGYSTLTAFSGKDALDVFQAEQPDLVLLDFAMPEMNGFEVCTEIRRLEPPNRHTLIVFITAYSQAFLVSVDFHVGVDSTLTKPIAPKDLVTHVNDLFTAHG